VNNFVINTWFVESELLLICVLYQVKMGKSELDLLGMEWLHLPTPDYSSPRLDTVIRAVRFIDSQVHLVWADGNIHRLQTYTLPLDSVQVRLGRAVLVHCNAGKGRSVVVTLAYLLYRHFQEGWNTVQAFDFVKSKRAVANMRARCGTHPQVGTASTRCPRRCASLWRRRTGRA
jgi:hypothetical protein